MNEPQISRRQVLELGVVAVPCLIGSTLLFDWLTGLTATEPVENAEPIVARYDPTAHAWGFVVDTTTCIGCGRCVVGLQAREPRPRGRRAQPDVGRAARA